MDLQTNEIKSQKEKYSQKFKILILSDSHFEEAKVLSLLKSKGPEKFATEVLYKTTGWLELAASIKTSSECDALLIVGRKSNKDLFSLISNASIANIPKVLILPQDAMAKLSKQYEGKCADFLNLENIAGRQGDGAPLKRSLRAAILYRDLQLEMLKKDQELSKFAHFKQEILSNFSHELMTPLNAIICTAANLLKRNQSPEALSGLRDIESSGEALQKMILPIIRLNKTLHENRNRIVSPEKSSLPFIDMRMAIERLISTFYSEIKRKNLYLRLTISPDVPRVVRGEGWKLIEILSCFVNNAIKFTDEGGIELIISAESGVQFDKEASNKVIEITFRVADSGIGVSPELAPDLFNFAFKGDFSSTKKSAGLGIGLSRAAQYASQINAKLSYLPNKGSGSVFTLAAHFTISVHSEINPEYPSNKFSTSDGFDYQVQDNRALNVNPSFNSNGVNPKILVVDDSLLNQKLLMQILKRLGCSVVTASDGEEAFEAAEHVAYDLIFMDCFMPHLSGFDASIKIRKLSKKNKKTPIVALTADQSAGADERAKSAGMSGFINKPINSLKLAAEMQKWLPYNSGEAKSIA